MYKRQKTCLNLAFLFSVAISVSLLTNCGSVETESKTQSKNTDNKEALNLDQNSPSKEFGSLTNFLDNSEYVFVLRRANPPEQKEEEKVSKRIVIKEDDPIGERFKKVLAILSGKLEGAIADRKEKKRQKFLNEDAFCLEALPINAERRDSIPLTPYNALSKKEILAALRMGNYPNHMIYSLSFSALASLITLPFTISGGGIIFTSVMVGSAVGSSVFAAANGEQNKFLIAVRGVGGLIPLGIGANIIDGMLAEHELVELQSTRGYKPSSTPVSLKILARFYDKSGPGLLNFNPSDVRDFVAATSLNFGASNLIAYAGLETLRQFDTAVFLQAEGTLLLTSGALAVVAIGLSKMVDRQVKFATTETI